MDFLTEEKIQEIGLTPEQLEALNPLYQEKKSEWDRVANDNANGILKGASESVFKKTNVEQIKGEKIADYIIRANEEYSTGLKSNLETAKLEYENKLKEFDGDSATKEELSKAKNALDIAKKELADYEPLKEKGLKFDDLQGKYEGLKKQVAYQSVKPSFPETVNPYEADVKWKQFIENVEENYFIEMVDNVAICKNKENEFKTIKLQQLVDTDETLKALLQGRKPQGIGGKPSGRKIDGLPFELPENITKQDAYKLIEDYIIATEGIKKTSNKFGERVTELWNKIPK